MSSGTSDSSAQAGSTARRQSFLSESLAELKKVTSPSRQETIQATIMTLALVLFFAVTLAVLDWVFKSIMWRLV
jgi:preprotein translocase SecE subunit